MRSTVMRAMTGDPLEHPLGLEGRRPSAITSSTPLTLPKPQIEHEIEHARKRARFIGCTHISHGKCMTLCRHDQSRAGADTRAWAERKITPQACPEREPCQRSGRCYGVLCAFSA